MVTASTLDNPPFELSFSRDVERFIFHPGWEPRQHYQAIFNSQDALLASKMPDDKPWAMMADWRRWLALTPENERLCVRTVHHFVERGMTHYALLADDHPVVLWQAEKVREANPGLTFRISSDEQELSDWLEEAGFDVTFVKEPFQAHWMQASHLFDQVLRDLNVDAGKFVTTPDFRPK